MTQPEFAPPPRFGSHQQFATDHAPQQLDAKPGRLFAIVALVLAGAGLLIGPINGVLSFLVLRDGSNYSLVEVIGAVGVAVMGLLALVALGFAIISLVRREPARVLAGIAIGVCASELFGVVSTLLQQLLYLTL